MFDQNGKKMGLKKEKIKRKGKGRSEKKIKNSTENVAPLDFAWSAIRDMGRVVV